MNRKRMIVEGAILGILFAIGIILLVRWISGRNGQPARSGSNASVTELAYCNDDQLKPCVVSFGIDANDKTLVNFLLPDLSFPNFYLRVIRGEADARYECQRIVASPNNAYCIGEKIPPGEILHLMLISTKDDVLLAEGRLSIIGLEFPTMEVVTATGTPILTETPGFILSTPTRLNPPTATATPPNYPNPPYP